MSNFTITGSITIGGTYNGLAITNGNITGGTFNGVTIDNNAWTTYAPAITAQAGTFTTTSAAGRYKQLGKTLFLHVEITITTVGSASGQTIFTLPGSFTTAATDTVISGVATTGKAIYGFALSSASSTLAIQNYDASSSIGAGNLLILTGIVEII